MHQPNDFSLHFSPKIFHFQSHSRLLHIIWVNIDLSLGLFLILNLIFFQLMFFHHFNYLLSEQVHYFFGVKLDQLFVYLFFQLFWNYLKSMFDIEFFFLVQIKLHIIKYCSWTFSLIILIFYVTILILIIFFYLF